MVDDRDSRSPAKIRGISLALLATCWLVPAARAWPAEPDGREIRIGISAPLSGPSQSLGLDIKRGIEACFRATNEAGGVDGRRLLLVALDDGYEPAIAGRNMVRLIDREQVLAVIGNVGSPTAEVTVPIANRKKVLLLGAYSGAPLLRKSPPDRYVINYRASYAEESAAIVKGLLSMGIRPFEIAFFSQNDSFGSGLYAGAARALKEAGFHKADQLAHGRYERNTLDVTEAALAVLGAEVKPRAVIMSGSYAPSARFIQIIQRVLPDTLFVNVSFVGSEALLQRLGPQAKNVVVTEVVPRFDSDLPLCRDYRRDSLQAFPSEPFCSVSLEGYIVARILVQGLQAAGPSVTRETLIDAIETMDELDASLGAKVRFSPTAHQGCHTVWPIIIADGKFVPWDWKPSCHPERSEACPRTK